jgi:hypothetical protein
MPRHGRELLLASRLLEEPAGLRWLDLEFEGAVREGSEFDFEGHVAANVRGDLVKLLAELHHVDAEWTQGLAHLGIGFGDAGVDAQVDGGCIRRRLPL